MCNFTFRGVHLLSKGLSTLKCRKQDISLAVICGWWHRWALKASAGVNVLPCWNDLLTLELLKYTVPLNYLPLLLLLPAWPIALGSSPEITLTGVGAAQTASLFNFYWSRLGLQCCETASFIIVASVMETVQHTGPLFHLWTQSVGWPFPTNPL